MRKLPKKERLSKIFALRVKPDVARRLQRKAKDAGLEIGEYLRVLIQKDITVAE
jgi:predicted HicB family RNase H-like nuclease